MKPTLRTIATLLAAAPLIAAAQAPTSGPEGPVSPNAPGGSSSQPTVGRTNTVTGVDPTDTRKNVAGKRVGKRPLVKKPVSDAEPPEASGRPNDRSRKDGAAP
jgi:hypothetical protein